MKHFNWVDVVIILLSVRIIYSGVKQGFSVEIFKFLAAVFGCVIAIHNFPGIANFLKERLHIYLWLGKIIAISALISLAAFIFWGLRIFLLKIMQVKFIPQVEKGGGIFFAFWRAVIVASLVLIILVFLPLGYIGKSVKYSLSGNIFLKAAPGVYSFCMKFYPAKTLTQDLNSLCRNATDK